MSALTKGDRDGFMQLESEMRQDAAMPPYGKLAAIIVEGREEREVADVARALVSVQQSSGKEIQHGANAAAPWVLGPAPAPLSLLRGKYRYRILIKAARNFALQEWLFVWLAKLKPPASVRVKVDIEPYSFY